MTDDVTGASDESTRGEADPGQTTPREDRRHRRPWRRRAGLAIVLLVALTAAAVVSVVTIDLGPAVRVRAERAATAQLDRPVRIGRLGTYLLPGRFLVEDLVIDGLSPGDDPFFTVERIVISVSWVALLQGEILIDDVDLESWRMVAESFPDGRQSFPRFVPEREADGPAAPAPSSGIASAPEPAQDPDAESARRLVTTVQHLRAHGGEFVFRDHNTPWRVVARDLDLTLEKREGYEGEVSFSGGTVAIRGFEPMTTDMAATYELEGGTVSLTRVDLSLDGFTSTVTGTVDLMNWPAQTYHILESDIHLPTMKDVFFAGAPFTVEGNARLTGMWRIEDGARDLTGVVESDRWTLNGFVFPDMTASLRWTANRFEVVDYRSGFHEGALELTYTMAPLGTAEPGMATLETTLSEVDVSHLMDAIDLPGIRVAARAGGHSVLRWPLGRFAEHTGEGRLTAMPPPGTVPLDPEHPNAGARGDTGYAAVRVDPAGRPWRAPVGGDVAFTIASGVVDIGPSRLATPATAILFEGRVEPDDASRVMFRVTSADWQESDRLMSSVMTAVGRPTGEVAVGGWGEMEGVMLGSLRAPRIEGRFDGRDLEAWNVTWGLGSGRVAVEDAYLHVTDGRFERGEARVDVEGRFAIGFPRDDGGEEINGRFLLDSMPAQTMREAFSIEGYEIDGPVSGEVELSGAYRRPFGTGRLTIHEPVAWGEPFDRGAVGLRFEGDGVRLDGLELDKDGGHVTGAMFIRWDGTYSLNVDGRGIPLGSIASLRTERATVSGTAGFTATGAGALANPRYEVRGTIVDVQVNGEALGQVTGRVDVRDRLMALDVEAASTDLAVSGSGRIRLGGDNEADLSLRFTNTALDPLLRAYDVSVPGDVSAVVSGTTTVNGPLRLRDRVAVEATVEQLQLDLFDYAIRNEEPVRLVLDRDVVRILAMRVQGDRTALALSGDIRLEDQRIDLVATGDASLATLQTFVPDIRGSGTAHLEATIGGTLRRPVIVGDATVAGGRVRHFALPHGLDEIEGRIVFEPDGLRFDQLSGVVADGPVQFGGRVGINGLEVSDLNVTVAATDMQLRFPEGVRSVVDAQLSLGGTLDDAVLSGTVTIDDAIWVQGVEPSTGFFEFTSSDAGLTPRAVDPVLPLRFDVRVLAPSSLRIDDRDARVVASAELTLGGTYDEPLLFGNAEIDRGEVFFEGNRYRVTRGSIGFADPTEINPFFDIEAETDIRVPAETYRVILGVSGTMDRLDVELSSDPPLQEFEILSLLLGDVRDPQASEIRSLRAQEEARQELLQAGAARLLTSPITSEVGRVVEESFGVDSFEITPALSDPTGQQSAQLLPTARVLIGKRISDRAHITFSQAVSGANQDLFVVLEYDQNDRVSWILSQNADRTYALDFRVRHAF